VRAHDVRAVEQPDQAIDRRAAPGGEELGPQQIEVRGIVKVSASGNGPSSGTMRAITGACGPRYAVAIGARAASAEADVRAMRPSK